MRLSELTVKAIDGVRGAITFGRRRLGCRFFAIVRCCQQMILLSSLIAWAFVLERKKGVSPSLCH
jgi:hypothetical protein